MIYWGDDSRDGKAINLTERWHGLRWYVSACTTFLFLFGKWGIRIQSNGKFLCMIIFCNVVMSFNSLQIDMKSTNLTKMLAPVQRWRLASPSHFFRQMVLFTSVTRWQSFAKEIIREYIGSLKIIREYIGSKPYRYGCITALMQRRWKAEFCNNQFDKIGRSSEIKLQHWSPASSITDKIIHFSDHKQRCKGDRKHKIGRSSEIKFHHWSLCPIHLIETFHVSEGTCRKKGIFWQTLVCEFRL